MKVKDSANNSPVEKLALLCLVKAKHGNSILYHEPWYKMGKKLCIDPKTFRKYLDECLNDGLCTKETQTYNRNKKRIIYRFISYRNALQEVLGITEKETYYFKIHKEVKSFKQCQKLIEIDLFALAIAKQNYQAQSHFPDKRIIMNKINDLNSSHVPGHKTRQQRASIARLVRMLSKVEQIRKYSELKGHCDSVVTGCGHMGRIIKRSRTTGHKRLKEMSENNVIQTHQIVLFTPVKSIACAYALIDNLKASKAKGIHIYSSKEGGVKSIRGLKVLGFNSPKLKIGTYSDGLHLMNPNT